MTKFVLDGGRPTSRDVDRTTFINEMFQGFEKSIYLLDCFFAKPDTEWDQLFDKDQKQLVMDKFPMDITFELAVEESFAAQVHIADVIYLHGGTTKKLLAALQKQSGWEKELDNKTVVGTSAGANVLARYYYGLHSLQIEEGLGILPIKVISHFDSEYNAPNIDWRKAHDEMKKYKEDLPLLALREAQFEVSYF